MRAINRVLFALVFLPVGVVYALLQENAAPPPSPPGFSSATEDTLSRWGRVYAYERDGLPRSAAAVAEQIIAEAERDNDGPGLLRALFYRAKYATYLEDDVINFVIRDLEDRLATAEPPLSSMLHSVLGEVYWRYYRGNRFHFLQRTHIAHFDESDVQTWDLRRLADRASSHYMASLEPAPMLRETPLAAFGSVLRIPQEGGELRPALYDFLVHRAVDFFVEADAEAGLPGAHTALNDALLFAPVEAFAQWDLPERPGRNFRTAVLAVLQRVLAFRAAEPDTSALVNADLRRLELVREWSDHPQADSLYASAIEHLIHRHQQHPASAEAALAQAKWLTNRDLDADRALAFNLCADAVERFPQSRGGRDCARLQERITHPEIRFLVEAAVLPGDSTAVQIHHRNVEESVFQIFPVSYDDWRTYRGIPHLARRALVDSLADRPPATQQNIALTRAADFARDTLETHLPALSAGMYLVTARSASDTTEEYSYHAFIEATGIGFLSRPAGARSRPEVLVVDRRSGTPLPDARVIEWRMRWDRGREAAEIRRGISARTNRDGIASLGKRPGWGAALEVQHEGRTHIAEGGASWGGFWQPEPRSVTHFFTDRAIYRPGQTVYFKGIRVRERSEDDHRVQSGRRTDVRLRDANHREISSLSLRTNEFGSFSGSFEIPADVLTGQFYLEDRYGRKSIRVEDYKRPRFEVVFDTLDGTPVLGETVTVTGRAEGFAGVPIAGAEVSFRVVRQPRFPRWWGWWMTPQAQQDVQVHHGTVQTDASGRFEIGFTAVPDRTVDRRLDASFTYRVTADVLDATGETQTGETRISIGRSGVEVDIQTHDVQEREAPSPILITTRNRAGRAVTTGGRVVVERLQAPVEPARPPLWLTVEAARRPANASTPPPDFNTWDVAERKVDRRFRTDAEGAVRSEEIRQWEPGVYRIRVEVADEHARPAHAERYITVVSSASEQMPYPSLSFFAPLKDHGEPGETARFVVGSSMAGTVLFDLEVRGRIVERRLMELRGGTQLIEVPIEESHRGNSAMHITMVRDNRAFTHTAVIAVPYSNKELDIRQSTFRDRLEPGAEERWTLTIAGNRSESIAAEMLALLYDASLDGFVRHHANLDLYHPRHARLGWRGGAGFGALRMQAFTTRPGPPSLASRRYPDFNWFGFNYFGHRPRAWPVRPARPGVAGGPADGRLVSGTVRDAETGEGLPGANITIDGTDYRSVTDREGAFKIRVPEGRSDLRVAFVGYESQKVSAADTSHIDVWLAPGGLELHEVVVTGQTRGLLSTAAKSEAPEVYLDVDMEADHGAQPPPPPGELAEIARLQQVLARENLNETAFFLPHLRTNAAGEISFSFTMPEALTRWRMLGLAHTRDMRIGRVEHEVVTQKDLMVTPHAPRFVREGDTIHFAAKVDNLSGDAVSGSAALLLFDAVTMQSADARLGNGESLRRFELAEGGSADFRWRLVVPAGMEALTYRVVAEAGDFSDGEENLLPVLTNRMLVTETLPLALRGSGEHSFRLDKLGLNDSETLRHHRLTLEFTPNPAWYAVASLPYLVEFPYECSEQIFSRFYANSIARHIVRSHPRIAETYRTWQDDDADVLRSKLERNEALKSLTLEETPWVWAARNEEERIRRMGRLFNERRMERELAASLRRLSRLQLPDGSWPWFQGGRGDRFITQHILTGFAHLDQLGVMTPLRDERTRAMINRAIRYADAQMHEQLEERRKQGGTQSLSPMEVHYLYARTFYPEVPLSDAHREMYEHYLEQAREQWLELSIYLRGMIGLALHRIGDQDTPRAITRSLREFSHETDEMGVYWPVNGGYFWHQAQVETHALLMELFHTVDRDTEVLDAMQTWLLKQRQVQDWRTTKATTAAVFALLMRGADLVQDDPEVVIRVGEMVFDLSSPAIATESGSGTFTTAWEADEISPQLAEVSVQRTGHGPAWGALYWQYFEDLDRITPHETPLRLEKELYVRRLTDDGAELERFHDGARIHPGDLLTARLTIRVDREMEYVHLKDMRASGLEPVNVLSGYRWQGTLGYYESTRDASTNFFFSRLPRGTHVFEYPLRVAHAGDFSNGIATIQSMYAPEFASHSAGVRLRVTERERMEPVAVEGR